MEEVKSGNLKAMIVRAADFYGPGARLSLIHSAVTERLKAGKKAQWIGDPGKIHTFTYTPDAGRTVALWEMPMKHIIRCGTRSPVRKKSPGKN